MLTLCGFLINNGVLISQSGLIEVPDLLIFLIYSMKKKYKDFLKSKINAP